MNYNEEFIKTQSARIYNRTAHAETQKLLDVGNTSDLELNVSVAVGANLARECVLHSIEHVRLISENSLLKDECADLRKKLLPDGISKEDIPIENEAKFPIVLLAASVIFMTLGSAVVFLIILEIFKLCQ